MSNTISIGLSALAAAQTGIATAGKNIANAAVDGYSRQKIVQGQEAGQGEGTTVTDIQRVFDSFLSAQQNAAQSSSSKLQVQYNQVQMINDYLADSSVGIAPALQDFFNSLQDISVAPKDITARQSFLNSASGLVASFNDAQSLLESISVNIDKQIANSTQSINTIASQVAKINATILVAQAQGGTTSISTLNDLYDKRDLLITQLSKITNVKVVNNNNIYDVFVGNSQSLINSTNVNTIAVVQTPGQASPYKIQFTVNKQVVELSSSDMSGGELQGNIDFKADTLTKIQNAIGKIAFGLATQVNTINSQGFTLTGAAGQPVFSLPTVDESTANPYKNVASNIKLLVSNVNDIAASGINNNFGDNSNILKIVALQSAKALDGVVSYTEAYAQIVSLIGSKTRELSLTNASAETILKHAQTALQNDSGVNLDEEAADLIRYQQAYQAAGKLIEISKTMFDTLMQLS
jgi:flagellar hook-associated protein 1 FlgK